MLHPSRMMETSELQPIMVGVVVVVMSSLRVLPSITKEGTKESKFCGGYTSEKAGEAKFFDDGAEDMVKSRSRA